MMHRDWAAIVDYYGDEGTREEDDALRSPPASNTQRAAMHFVAFIRRVNWGMWHAARQSLASADEFADHALADYSEALEAELSGKRLDYPHCFRIPGRNDNERT
jgi:hypothetical protein